MNDENENHNENETQSEIDRLADQITELSARQKALSVVSAAAELREEVGYTLDPLSMFVGRMVATVESLPAPDFVKGMLVKTAVEMVAPQIEMVKLGTTVENAFDDLPTFDPGNGS